MHSPIEALGNVMFIPYDETLLFVEVNKNIKNFMIKYMSIGVSINPLIKRHLLVLNNTFFIYNLLKNHIHEYNYCELFL